MLDFLGLLAILDFGIDDADPVFEERRQIAARQVTVFIDRGGEDRSTVLPIPRGIIAAAAKK